MVFLSFHETISQTAAYWLSFCFRRVDKSRSNICFILYIFTFWWIFQDRNRKQNCKIFICSLIIVIWTEVICSSVARGFQILCSNGKVVIIQKWFFSLFFSFYYIIYITHCSCMVVGAYLVKKVDSCKYSGHPVMQHEFLIRSIKAQKKLKYDLN